MKSLDEHSLINLYNQDKEIGLEAIFRQFYPQVYTTAFNLIDEPREAKNIATNIFLSLWKQREPLMNSISLKYMFRDNIIESCIKQIKSKRKISFALRQEEAFYKLGPIIFDYESDDRPLMTKIVAALPEKCKLVFRLSRFESLKHADIAEILDTSQTNIEKEMLTAMRLIREGLKQYG